MSLSSLSASLVFIWRRGYSNYRKQHLSVSSSSSSAAAALIGAIAAPPPTAGTVRTIRPAHGTLRAGACAVKSRATVRVQRTVGGVQVKSNLTAHSDCRPFGCQRIDVRPHSQRIAANSILLSIDRRACHDTNKTFGRRQNRPKIRQKEHSTTLRRERISARKNVIKQAHKIAPDRFKH